MRSRFVFALATLVLVGCTDGTLTGHRTLEAESQTTDPDSSPTTRRLWSGREVDSLGSPSRDGQFLSFVDWRTGDLALRELATGQTRSIVKTRGDLSEFAYYSVISPDGKRLAYSFFDGEIYDVRVVGSDGSAPHTVFRRTESLEAIAMGWSADSTQILATVRWKDATSQIVVINADNGATRTLKTLGWQYPSRLAFSPDGRHIAYDFAPDGASTKRDIAILAADGGADTPIVAHDGDDRVLGWSPDGRLFFSSDREGTQAVWAVSVTNGRAAADPVRLKVDLWRFEHPLGFDKNGVFYYSVNPTVADLYVATIDPTSLKVTTAAQPVSAEDGATHGPGAWSPDGRLLAYLVSDEAVSVSFSRVIIRSLETGDQRILTPQLTQLRSVQWFPGGRSLLVGAIDLKGRVGLYRVDAQSGSVAVVRLRSNDAQNMFGPSLSPDGATLYFRTFADTKGQISLVMARDLGSGAEREVYRDSGQIGWPSPSPDGKQLAFAVIEPARRQCSIVVVPATGGQARTLVTLPEGYAIPANRGRILWGPSNNLMYMPTNANRETEVWSVRVDGSGAQKLDLNLPAMMQPQLHPDGRRLLFRAGELTKEIWAMQSSASR
jgi:Tol biopolymer transport system component